MEDKGEWLDVQEARKRFASQPEVLERVLALGERKDHAILGELVRIPRIVDSRKAAEDNEEFHLEEVHRPGARLNNRVPQTGRQKSKRCTDEGRERDRKARCGRQGRLGRGKTRSGC